MAVPASEFPLLEEYDLVLTETTGDGNCLFNALSEQLYGDESYSAEIRADTVQEMRDNESQYIDFLPVRKGGGIRSNPKRVPKRKKDGTPTYNVEEATTAEDARSTWENYLKNMGKSGVFADNLEVQAFTQAYQMDVVIFRFDNTILHMKYKQDNVERPVAFVALHDWEHYSSLRNTFGPFEGPAADSIIFDWVKFRELQNNRIGSSSPSPPPSQEEGPVIITDEMVATLMAMIPEQPIDNVRRALATCNGSYDRAATKLLDEEEASTSEYSSFPGTDGRLTPSGGSESVEPDQEDEEEAVVRGPVKRRKGGSAGKPIPAVKITKPNTNTNHDTESAYDSEEVSRRGQASFESTPASSRSHSIAPGQNPRVRIILRTKSQKKKLEKMKAISQSTTSAAPSPPSPSPSPSLSPSSSPSPPPASVEDHFEDEGIKKQKKKKKKLILVKDPEEQKKAVPKEAAAKKLGKERLHKVTSKRESPSRVDKTPKRSPSPRVLLENAKMASIDSKRPSPPMEKVLQMDGLNMIR